jgi:nicotinate-nucleotide adenylyltransferase
LKQPDGIAPFATRLASARAIADGRRILATDVECRLGTRYTVDTLKKLRRLFPRARFVWLMGADNLAGFPAWRGWRRIARTMPFAVHPRPTYNLPSLARCAARALRSARQPARAAKRLACLPPPAWLFLPAAQNPASATALREAGQKAAILPANEGTTGT